ncbi:MAG: hypothetical protein LBD11_08480 [Candidatus Peribacteria bacterium]|jgi:hypothetical protein|nr:hypothetical protein [Candidatus Peribacteria bacterium]
MENNTTPTLDEVQAKYKELYNEDVPNNKKNDQPWIEKKIADFGKDVKGETQPKKEKIDRNITFPLR